MLNHKMYDIELVLCLRNKAADMDENGNMDKIPFFLFYL